MAIHVLDDNAPMADAASLTNTAALKAKSSVVADDLIGTAQVPLAELLHQGFIDREFSLVNPDGADCGFVHLSMELKDSESEAYVGGLTGGMTGLAQGKNWE